MIDTVKLRAEMHQKYGFAGKPPEGTQERLIFDLMEENRKLRADLRNALRARGADLRLSPELFD